MKLVGVDLHTREQSIATVDTETGETQELRLRHEGDEVERFYRNLTRPVTVGIESTGYALWFHHVMHRLGHTLVVGDAAKIRATVVRRTKTDRRAPLRDRADQVRETRRVVTARPADELDRGSAFIRDDPPAVDLLLVDPAQAVEGLANERRDGGGDAERGSHDEPSASRTGPSDAAAPQDGEARQREAAGLQEHPDSLI